MARPGGASDAASHAPFRKYAPGLIGSRATMRTRTFSAVACALWLTHCSHAPTTLEAQAPNASPAPVATTPAAASQESTAPTRPTYPVARKDDVVENYHGTQVAD